MISTPFKRRGLFFSILTASGLGLTASLAANTLDTNGLNQEVQALLSTPSDNAIMTEALTDSLYALGWSEELATAPYLEEIQDDLAMQTLLHESQLQLGYDFIPVDCTLSDWQSVPANSVKLTEDFTQHSCLDGFKKEPFDIQGASVVYLVAADVVGQSASGKDQSVLNIETPLGAVDWISRKIQSNPVVPVQQEWFTLSNQCAAEPCDMGLVLRGLAADSEIKLQLKGVYTASKKSNKSTTNFINGDFSGRDNGWLWRQRAGQEICFSNLSAPSIRAFPDIRYHSQTGNAYAAASGRAASANAASQTVTASISQLLSSVPENATVNFRFSLSQATMFNGTAQRASMRLVAQNLTTGRSDVIFSHAVNSGSTGWRNGSADLSAYANNRVNFRFEICSSLTSSTGAGSSFHGLMLLDDVALQIEEPVAPTGDLTQDGPCQLTGSNNTCTTNLSWQSQDTQRVCIWHADGVIDLLSCSTANQGITPYHNTTISPTNIVMKNHVTPPGNNLADYNAGTFLDAESVRAIEAVGPTGILNSTSPCEIPAGSNRCTVTLKVQAQNTPINCLWTTSPSMRLVNCSTATLRNYNWIYANTTGHQFELRAHNTYPQQTNADRLSGTLLDGERVFAIMSNTITPDYYDNVAVRGYDDDRPGDAVVLYAGQSAQLHNFHDAGDQDWTIFALGAGQSVRVNTSPTGTIAAKMVAYRVTGAYSQIAPGRWDITLSDLTQVAADTSTGYNAVTINNNTSQLQVYVVKTYGTAYGSGSGYYISATGL